MGKNIRSKLPSLPFESPKCMWNAFQMLDYHHWRRVKKMLPHKGHANGRQLMGIGLPEYDTNASISGKIGGDIDMEKDKSLTERTGPETKAGKKTQNAKEMSKKNAQHRRTLSQLSRTRSIHHLEPSDQDPLSEIIPNINGLGTVHRNNEISPTMSTSTTSDGGSLQLTASGEPTTLSKKCVGAVHERCKSCGTVLSPTSLRNGRIDELGEKSAEIGTLVPEKLDKTKEAPLEPKFKYAKELTGDTSFYQSKEFTDALNIISMNRDLFLKILQDPNSDFAHHFLDLQAHDTKMELNKSGPSPIAGLSLRVDNEQRKVSALKPGHDIGSFSQGMSDESDSAQNSSRPSVSNHSGPKIADGGSASAHLMNNKKGNSAAIKHFRSLKQNIKHAIKENQKEKHRISRDAVFHKIPYGQRLSKDHQPAIDRNITNNSESSYPRKPVAQSHMTRASSLKESLDRYSQLFESSFNSAAMDPDSEKLKLRTEEEALSSKSAPKYLGRILSLPDIKSQSQVRGEDSYDSFSSRTSIRTSIGSQCIEQESGGGPLDLGNHTHLTFDSESEEHVTDSCLEPVARDEQEVSSTDMATAKLSEPYPLSVHDYHFQEDAAGDAELPIPEAVESRALVEEMEVPSKLSESDFVRLYVEPGETGEYNFVRDVLELSGFSGAEILGKWHSTDQPLDPQMFDEIEDCFPVNSDNEEKGYCNRLLLYDIINEVLLDIYERSFTYCPLLLSSFSHVRPMPTGFHVLKEVWLCISWHLRSSPAGCDQSLEYVANQDLSKNDEWMRLRFDTECIGLEVEDLIFDDLIEVAFSST